jgi:hypothetical protein
MTSLGDCRAEQIDALEIELADRRFATERGSW